MSRGDNVTINARDLADFLTSRDHGGSGGEGREEGRRPKVPSWVDPSRYPRRARIEDEEAQKLIHDMEAIVDQLRGLARKAEVLDAKLTIARTELFEKLEALYPTVLNIRRGGAGLRDYNNAWWYVGWNAQAYGDEPDGGGPDGTGVYL